jgi:nitroreductase
MDVLEAIRLRRSVRDYSRRAIPEEVTARLCEALRDAPSACNNQPWRFVLVFDEQLRRDLARASKEQNWMAAAPLIVVGCGFPDQAYQWMGGSGNSLDIDLAIALDHLTLVAAAEGLGTCWIGAFAESEVKRVVGIPDHVKVVAMITVGYPSSADLNRPVKDSERKASSETFSRDRFPAAN